MIPSNYHHVVRYATYTYSSHNRIPEHLQLAEEVQILSLQVVPRFSLVKEYELIAQYGDWSSSQKSKKAQDSSRSMSPPSNKAPNPNDPYDLQNLTGEVFQMKEETPVVNHGTVTSIKASTTGYDQSNYALPELGNEKNSPPVSNSNGTSNEYLVLRMMQETGQERDICYYVLESVNWDFNQAMEIMMQNMQVK